VTSTILPQKGLGEREIEVKVRIRETLYKEACKHARAVGMNVERFMAEIVETDMAVRRQEEADENSARAEWT
jgi:hypothetical protein